MDMLRELFLSPEALQRILAYMCRGTNQDPIVEAVRTMLTVPVQFHVSKHGLGLFKGWGVFPYTFMTGHQRNWLYDLLHAMGGSMHHSALACISDPLEYMAENDRIFFKGPTIQLDPKLVFDVLIQSIKDSGSSEPARLRLLLNLLIQRIGCKVSVSRDTLQHVEARAAALL